MLDIKFIRKNQKQVKKAVKNKNLSVDIDKLLLLDEEKRGLLLKIDKLRAERNEIAKVGKNKKPSKKLITQGKKIKKNILKIESKLNKIENNYNNLIYLVPNLYSNDTPIGHDESDNKIIKQYGKIPKFDFKVKNHMELGILHNIIDTKKSSIISGARFDYLFNDAVKLQFAIIQFVIDTLTDKEIIKKLANKVGNPFDKTFVPVITPVIVKSEIMKKMDRFDPLDDRYYLEQDDSLLVGSAEHALGPLHINEIIEEKNLPIRYLGYSTAFRREAGTYGKDMNGILRRHQFDKLEMESFIQPEYGLVEQNLIIAIQEYLTQQLEIPYQLVLKCTGDMGKQDFRAIDVECWMPGQNKYRETHTSDYMTDFQSRRLNTKYRTKNNKKKLVHMNDATAFAIGRILIAILENYQQKDSSIIVPKVLRKWVGKDVIKKSRKNV
ncbi:MAG: serine--tRNA ligase [Xanthomonadaceae bacterium]|nr:serine--tRNA ligase [Rhodospirillaceae bacterium]NIA17621.1 serine--tRNA ligase [Xanthomonadaceae bacterium]